MIKIENPEKQYHQCNSCENPAFKKITIGDDEKSTQSFRLCKRCFESMFRIFSNVIIDEFNKNGVSEGSGDRNEI